MSQLRSMQRKQEAAQEKRSLRHFDLADTKLTDIDGIEIDTGDEELIVRLLLPVGEEAYAEYEEVVDLRQAPSYLRQAARQFAAAVLRAVRDRQITKEELLCATCNGACCRNSIIELTAEDVEQLKSDGVDMSSVKMHDQPSTLGHVAEFVVLPAWDNPEDTCCVHCVRTGAAFTRNARPSVASTARTPVRRTWRTRRRPRAR